MDSSNQFFLISGIFSSMLAGMLFLLGVGILMSWKLPEWPWWIDFPVGILLPLIAYLTYSIFLMPHREKRSIKFLFALMICIFTAVEVALVGYSIMEISVFDQIPDWPIWAGWVLTVCGFLLLIYGIDRFFEIKE